LIYGLGVLIALLVIAWFVYRIAVRLGGRKVLPLDASAWIIPPHQDVEVIRDPHGALVIRWRVTADWVAIYTIDHPDDPVS
jgi:hypothetical protein